MTLTVVGEERWNRALSNLTRFGKRTAAEADPIFQRWGEDSRDRFRATPYPPELPNQRYVRTGRLGRSWQHNRLGQSHLVIRNAASDKGRIYSRYVVGWDTGKGQARIHQGRWWLSRTEILKMVPPLVEKLKAHFKGLA